MKCKQNDMAVIIGGRSGDNLGEEVTCLMYVGMPEFDSVHDDVWRIDKPVRWSDGIDRPYMPDSLLMPIRPRGDAEDLSVYDVEVKVEEKEDDTETNT